MTLLSASTTVATILGSSNRIGQLANRLQDYIQQDEDVDEKFKVCCIEKQCLMCK
jgi:hypothetical protein